MCTHSPPPRLPSDADLTLNRNIFIETALGYALTYITSLTKRSISSTSITILADNDYYSTPPSTTNGHASTKRFHNYGVPIDKAHKTGLGSSAALVTAFTAALLTYYLPKSVCDITTEQGQRRLHNLAQISHCAAQGKVGSGFDIATAVYGSCLYRRFSPSILANSADPGSKGFTTALRGLIEETGSAGKWDTEIHGDAVKIPAGLRLVMCDVSCGSKTPGMVKKVLAWRKERPEEADAIWADLHQANESLARELKAMAEKQDFGLERLRTCFTRIRRGIRLMSEVSGVPIEPPSQTKLIDACEALPGVVGGVVPGAGGYDAITLLIEDKAETVAALEELLAGWEFKGEDVEGGGKVGMLGVREEIEGVKVGRVRDYEAWL